MLSIAYTLQTDYLILRSLNINYDGVDYKPFVGRALAL